MIAEKIIDGYVYSSDTSRLQVEVIHRFLSSSYWSPNIARSQVEQAIRGSVCFGVYASGHQVGFARVITDSTSFGYLADVFILEEHRGKGLSKELMRFILAYEPFKHFRRFMLATRDAQGLYKQFGFTPLAEPERFMEFKPTES